MKKTLRLASLTVVAWVICLPSLLGQDPAPKKELTSFESFDEMHGNYVERFIASQGFGVARMPQPLMLDHSKTLLMGSDVFSVETIELIGLLKQIEPVAYRPMPHGERGRRFVPRQLTEFEAKALARLRNGENLLLEQNESGAHLVGSIRAQASCLQCHEGKKEGDLLGAFTYKLKRTENRPPPEKSER